MFKIGDIVTLVGPKDNSYSPHGLQWYGYAKKYQGNTGKITEISGPNQWFARFSGGNGRWFDTDWLEPFTADTDTFEAVDDDFEVSDIGLLYEE